VTRRRKLRNSRSATLWGGDAALDQAMLAYTVGDDRDWDQHLLPWDVLGSLGHVEGLRASGLLTGTDHRKLRTALRAAFHAVLKGRLVIGVEHEDAHSAVELWLTHYSSQRLDVYPSGLQVWTDAMITADVTNLELQFRPLFQDE